MSAAAGTPPAAASCCCTACAARRLEFPAPGAARPATALRSDAALKVRIGSRKETPAPDLATVSAFAGWSPKMGTTASGTPKPRASCMLLAPPWVTMASERRSISSWGTMLRTTKLSGTGGKPSKTSSLGPSDKTTRKALSPPKASKQMRQTRWQNSLPVISLKGRRPPSSSGAKFAKGFPQKALLVATVPRETKMTFRPACCASWRSSVGKAAPRSWPAPGRPAAAGPAASPLPGDWLTRFTFVSMRTPTQAKGKCPNRRICCSVRGGAKSASMVVTMFTTGEYDSMIIPSSNTSTPYRSAIARLGLSTQGCASNFSEGIVNTPGPGMVNKPTAGMPMALAATRPAARNGS
mmetsp:Transcript_1439/g.4189  ORF Transcript_1439/g.4189 Transcript_1439/m.4189 type:complete len:352 (-) Transcript_1439:444-1499(-)